MKTENMESTAFVIKKRPRFFTIKQSNCGDILFRNVWCPEYERCLREAAMDNVHLDCSLCPWKQSQRKEHVLTGGEIQGCIALLAAIFMPDRHRRP
jgi:hypothetical protein